MMDRNERLDTIDRLECENLESRAYLEERRRQRECDPIVFDDYLRAEREAEAERSPPVNENDDTGLVYKEYDNSARAVAASSDDSHAGWNAWLKANLANERAEVLDAFTHAMGEVIAELRSEWRSEIEALRREWQKDRSDRAIRDQTIVERSARIAQLQKENAEAHAQLSRQQLDRSFAERDARLERLETKLGMLLSFIGGDLPRGFGT